ncbi:MAG: asparagine synthetase B family protein, partial [Longimicrobiales bacterium]
MCGIAGFFTGQPTSADLLNAKAGEMADRLIHRGPDDRGTWADPLVGVAFGFRRLAIIDLSENGHQPMVSHSGESALVFNGEVYNYQELRGELEAHGTRFRGHSDSEVILEALERWGVEETLPRLSGMFSIAFWDSKRRRLTLARDRLGIKPLFIYHRSGLVSFGSELKALAAGPSFDRTLDLDSVSEFLRYLYVPAPNTIFANV